jgi:hypothetical protein
LILLLIIDIFIIITLIAIDWHITPLMPFITTLLISW